MPTSDAVLRVERKNHDGKQHDGYDLQHPIDRHLNLGNGAREGTSLLGQALRVDALTDRSRDHAARTRDDARSRKKLIPLLLLDGARLAGQQRFVDLQAHRGQDRTVDAHLIAESQLDHVIEDHVARGHHRKSAVA